MSHCDSFHIDTCLRLFFSPCFFFACVFLVLIIKRENVAFNFKKYLAYMGIAYDTSSSCKEVSSSHSVVGFLLFRGADV